MNTTVWLISFLRGGQPHQVVHTHNAIADYRGIDSAASATAIDCAEIIGEANALKLALAGYDTVQNTMAARISWGDSVIAVSRRIANAAANAT